MLEVISPIGLPTYNNESFVFDFEYASDLLGKTIMEFLLASISKVVAPTPVLFLFKMPKGILSNTSPRYFFPSMLNSIA